MAVRYSDAEVHVLIQEDKVLPQDWRERLRTRPKRGHEEASLDVTGEAGNEFRVILRQNTFNPLDFSVILGVQLPSSSTLFRLRRHNGRSHQHTNSIEEESFYDYHIHMATERYQARGEREDSYAESITDRYGDLNGALDCMLVDGSFIRPEGDQLSFRV